MKNFDSFSFNGLSVTISLQSHIDKNKVKKLNFQRPSSIKFELIVSIKQSNWIIAFSHYNWHY